MDLVKIDVVRLQAPQARFALLDDMPAGIAAHVRIIVVHGPVHLRAEEDLVALGVALERLAGEFLAFAPRVNVGCVDAIDARIDRVIDDPAGFLEIGFATEHHATEGKRADLYARATKIHVVHAVRLLRYPTMANRQA